MKTKLKALFSIALLSGCVALITPNVEQSFSELKAGQYALDKSHGSLLFKIRHIGLSTYVGRFNSFDASLEFDPENIAAAKLEAIIEIDSLDINNPDLRDDLMKGSWFDQANYPQARFSTLSVRPVSESESGSESGSEFEFTGTLDWRGVSKPITLLVTFHGGANNILTGKYTLGFSARGSFKRSEFGMDAYIPLVGDEVRIETEAEFLKN